MTTHCTSCHFKNGYSPFSLENYNDVSKRADFILYVLENKIMPPWTADTTYRSFKNQNVVSKAEIEIFRRWINEGKQEGELSQSQEKKSIEFITQFDTTWHFGMSRKYKVAQLNQDVFKRFYVKTDIDRDIYASRFEFRPGNTKIVHHSEVFIDTAHHLLPEMKIPGNEIISGDGYEQRSSDLSSYNYLTGWLPGELYEEFPSGICAKIPKGSSMYFLMHYSSTPVEEIDSSVFLIHENMNVGEKRYYETIDIHGHSDVSNGPFIIQPDTVVKFHAIKEINHKISAFSLLVHAHHLAKSVLAYIVTPSNDTIPLIKIPEWNFDWQFVYKFKEFEIIPSGSIVHYFVTYDNTSNNPENPNNPPKKVRYSFEADQEMMELFIYYVPYMEGDETKLLDYSED